MEFEGEFETHVTVHAAADLAALRAWAEARRLTFHHIVLDRGLTPSQPMVGRRGRGRLSAERTEAADICRRLTDAGFTVTRVKIEAAPWNQDVPVLDADADQHPDRYFEHHIKLELDAGADLASLAALAVEHSAHLSRNARRVRADGRQERFVTQRCHAVGRDTAGARLNTLRAALAADGYSIVSVEEEYVVYDSAPGIDAGWLDRGEAP